MFFGREEELDSLLHHWGKVNPSSLITCRGRRRVGKSRLIAEFANRSKARFIKLEGVPPAKGVNNATQLRAIAEQLSKMSGEDVKIPENWFDAFHLINDAINPAVRTVLLLDFDHLLPADQLLLGR